MKKIILTIVLSSLLPAIAVAKDAEHKMRNDNPNASVMEGKHMMNSNPNASVMEGRHMMNDNPNASHPSKGKAGATKTSDQDNRSGYSVVPYKK